MPAIIATTALAGRISRQVEEKRTASSLSPERLPGSANEGLRVVELDVPIDVVAPALWRIAQPKRHADRRRLIWPPWVTNQMHAGLLRRTAALPPVARD